MAFSLHPAGPEDVEDIARIWHDAFKDDPILGNFHKKSPRDAVREQDVRYFSDVFKKGDIYGGRFLKVVEETSG